MTKVERESLRFRFCDTGGFGTRDSRLVSRRLLRVEIAINGTTATTICFQTASDFFFSFYTFFYGLLTIFEER